MQAAKHQYQQHVKQNPSSTTAFAFYFVPAPTVAIMKVATPAPTPPPSLLCPHTPITCDMYAQAMEEEGLIGHIITGSFAVDLIALDEVTNPHAPPLPPHTV